MITKDLYRMGARKVFVIMKPPMTRPGALYGLAIGDALGMPTQLLSRRQIVARWGRLLRGFEPAPPGHPIAAGLPAGAVTDDTEQAVLLGRLLVKGHGAVDPRELAEALVSWERDMAARGSLDLLGPSTKRARGRRPGRRPARKKRAPPATTNGAAMRIAPVGIAVALDLREAIPCPARSPRPAPRPAPTSRPVRPRVPSGLASRSSLSALVDQVVAASRVTHNTGLALAGAAAVAAAVSAGVAGACIAEATALATAAAGSRPAAGTGWPARTSRPASNGPPAWSRAGTPAEAAG